MPSLARRRAGTAARSWPSSSTRPSWPSRKPMTRRSSVVLPAPLRPTTATVLPRVSSQLMPRSTGMPAMVVETFSSLSMGSLADHVLDDDRVAQHLVGRAVGGNLAGDPGRQAGGVAAHDVDVVLHEDAGDLAFVQRLHQ